MGRNKRKIKWRRLSIGGNSGNEDEDVLESQDGETSSTHPKLNLTNNNSPSKITSSLSHRQRSGSQPCMINHSFSTNKPALGTGVDQNSSSTSTTGPSSPNMLTSSSKQPLHNGGGGGSNSSNSHSPSDNGTISDNGGGSGYDDHNPSNKPPRRPQPPYDNHYRYASAQSGTNYHHPTKEPRGDHPRYGGGGYHNSNGGGGYGGYQSSNNYYNNHHRNSYNNYRNSSSHYDSGGGGGGGGYRGNGNGYGPPPPSSRYGGRFRKPRPYSSSSYYYQNGPHSQSTGLNGENKPSYNQEEYTKITTPRQDVLFKKGYLATRKAAVTQSGSVDSGTSGPPTPSASTNGTPDTHSINGIHSDYSESYENGETDGVVGGYDDTVYYGPPAEAVFTDPNTGQIYYGQCSPNGEYFDAYPMSPVMVTAGYPGPAVYYQIPYPVSSIDWNGTPMYPLVAAAPAPPTPAIPYDNTTELTQGVEQTGTKNYPAQSLSCPPKINAKGESSDEFSTTTDYGGPAPGADKPNNDSANSSSSSSTNGPIHSEPMTTKGTKLVESSSKRIGKKKESQDSGTLSDASSTSSRENSTLSSSTSPPLSPKEVGPITTTTSAKESQLCSSMSNLNLNNNCVPGTQEVPTIHHHLPHHHHHALPTFLAPIPVATAAPTHVHGHGPHGPPPPLQPILFTPHPHPGTYATYGPPIYNGVVVPITPVVPTSSASSTSPESNSLDIRPDTTDSQKYCKKKRRKKDSGQGQLTDESSDDSTNTTPTPTPIPTPTSISIIDTQIPNPDKNINIITTKQTLLSESSTDSDNLTCRSVNSSPLKQATAEKNLQQLDEPEQETNLEIININTDSKTEEASKIDKTTSTTGKIIKNSDSDNDNTNRDENTNNQATTNKSSSSEQTENDNIKNPEKNITIADSDNVSGSANETSNKPYNLVLEPFAFAPINPSPQEPSSPDVDSLNTTQSVAGSEAPSFGNSISESDYNNYMNRTTSVDEVEDLESEQSQEDQPEFSHGRLESVKLSPLEISHPTLSTETTVTTTRDPSSPTPSPPHTPKNSNETTPSPETLFERQLEPPLLLIPLDKVSVERTSPENLHEAEPITQTQDFKILKATSSESEQIIQTIDETFTKEPEPICEVLQVKIEEPLPIIQIVETNPPEIRIAEAETLESNIDIDNANLESEVVPESLISSESTTTPATEDRPKSLAVAVAEWLKAAGPDALTPVAQLRAQFENAEDDGDEDVEDSDDEGEESESEESLTADDLGSDEQNQKNVQGSNPWAVLSNNSNNKPKVTRKLKSDSIIKCSKVAACLMTSAAPTFPPMLKMSEASQHKDEHESSDSGLESSVSSPESTPSKEIGKKNIADTHTGKLSSFSFDDNFDLDNPQTEETCNPTKFSKYYQFGVVFDDMKDQGIDIDMDEFDNSNLEVDIGENGAPTIIIYTNPHAEPETIYCDDEDEELEEIGTFDPKFLKHMPPLSPPTPPDMTHSISDDDEQEYVRSNHKTTATIPSTHLYVNPFSLAQEMGEEISKVPSLLPQSPEEKLPDYVSPPAPEVSTGTEESHVVFNPNSSANIIRTQFGLPHGICCVIQ